MFEGKDYRPVDVVYSILCGFIDGMTGYTKSPMMTREHTMYSSFIGSAVSGN